MCSFWIAPEPIAAVSYRSRYPALFSTTARRPGQLAGAPGTGSGLIFYWGTSAPAKTFRITNAVVNATPISQTTFSIGFPGAQPIYTATDMQNKQAFARTPIVGL